MSVQFREFDFDANVEVAPVIYRAMAHRVTPVGAAVSSEARAELLEFIRQYAAFIGAGSRPYFRLDVYIAEGKLWVLEVNAAFVDGWGVALNLSRAANAPVDITKLEFPGCFGLIEAAYRPELELLVSELATAGRTNHRICDQWRSGQCSASIYVYGRAEGDQIWPQNGLVLDNKLNLARFSRRWQGDLVGTPTTYTHEDTEWAEVPGDVFLKFVDKSSAESQRARFSVKRGKPTGKSPFLRRCYDTEKLIAQQQINGDQVVVESHPRRVQLVVLSNADMLTGYTQYGLGDIINDDSWHGPLIF